MTGASRSEDMRELHLKLLQLAEEVSTAKAPNAPEPEASDAGEPEAPDAPKAEIPVSHHWFTTGNKAWYVSIKQGYQFYPPKPTTA